MIDNCYEPLISFVWKQMICSDAPILTTKNNVISKVVINEQIALPNTTIFDVNISIDSTSANGYIIFLSRTSLWYERQRLSSEIKNRTILIVTTSDDRIVLGSNNSAIPVVEISVGDKLMRRYLSLIESRGAMCSSALAEYDYLHRLVILDKLLIERFNNKVNNISSIFYQLNQDWNDTFMYLIFDTIAISSKNRQLFCNLSRNIGYSRILSKLTTLQQTEALLFGAAGLLESAYNPDEYTLALRHQFYTLRQKYSIQIINANAWNFSSMTLKSSLHMLIANLAYMIHNNKHFLDDLINHNSFEHLCALFSAHTSTYWHNHDAISSTEYAQREDTDMSLSKRDTYIINLAVPLLFAYSRINNEAERLSADILFDYLHKLRPENNRIASRWSTQKFRLADAYDSQAVIQLYKCYCSKSLCINCPMAVDILKSAI